MTTGASRVLAALRNGTRKPCSGVRLSETLGVSRASGLEACGDPEKPRLHH